MFCGKGIKKNSKLIKVYKNQKIGRAIIILFWRAKSLGRSNNHLLEDVKKTCDAADEKVDQIL